MSTFNARAVVLLAAVALSGCGGGGSSNISANAADADADKTTPLQPGRWQLTIAVDRDYVRPFGSTPPSDPEREPQSLTTSSSVTVCVTPEIAAAPGPVLITASDNLVRCQQNSWRMKDGTIDGDLTCAGGPTGSVPLRIRGSYSRTRFDSESDEGSQGVMFREKVAARRLGDCKEGDRPTWTPRSFSDAR